MNESNAIDARDRNMAEWRQVQGLFDKIRSAGMGGISADDSQAVAKLESKLASLESVQERMKTVNAYYRKHKTLLNPSQARTVRMKPSRTSGGRCTKIIRRFTLWKTRRQ